jgi:hypothetical protein
MSEGRERKETPFAKYRMSLTFEMIANIIQYSYHIRVVRPYGLHTFLNGSMMTSTPILILLRLLAYRYSPRRALLALAHNIWL